MTRDLKVDGTKLWGTEVSHRCRTFQMKSFLSKNETEWPNYSLLRRIGELERCYEDHAYHRIAKIEDVSNEKPNLSSPPARNFHNKWKSKLASICYYYNAPGHIKRDCPLLKDHKNTSTINITTLNAENIHVNKIAKDGTQKNNSNNQSSSRRNQGNCQ